MPTTLLLADDSVVIQKLVGLSFINEDIKIVSVDNGDDAVIRAVECKPDIILADVVMPGKSGYEVCSAIRNNPDLANTPVLLLTGTFEAFDEDRARDVGATGHITKPFEAQALVDRVNAILAQHKSSAAAANAPTADTDFFADALSESNAADLSADVLARSVFDQNEVLTPVPLAPGSTDEINATSIPIEPARCLDDLLDGAGGDLTVAIIPEAFSDVPSNSEPVAMDSGSMSTAPIPNPDQTMLVDDFFADSGPLPDAITSPAPTVLSDVNSTIDSAFDSASATKSAFGAVSLTGLAAPDPMPKFVTAPAASNESPCSATLESQVAPPPVPEEDVSEFADFDLGGEPDVPHHHLDNPNLDATLLADDMFGGDPEFPDIPDLDDNFDAGMADPFDTNFAASQGLDIDFGAPAGGARVPENANDYDVSTSDLGDGLLGDSLSWSAGVPAGIVTGPEPIAATSLAVEPQLPELEDDMLEPLPSFEAPRSVISEEPIPLLNEPRGSAAPEDAPSRDKVEPEISFAPPAPVASPLDETQDVISPAPEPESLQAQAAMDLQSDATNRPDHLTPVMRDRIHDTLEKIAWEAFADLSDDIVRQLMQRVEQIAWEVIPQMAETLIQDEIRRMKGDEGEE